MKKKYAVSLTAISIALCVLLVSNMAVAITGNFSSDETSYVGVVVLFSDTERNDPVGYCTGFLISPTVMLTAGHSLIGIQAVSVCFEKGPIIYAISEDGDLIVDLEELTIYEGKDWYPYDGYNPSLSGNQEYATSDIGVIILHEPGVKDIIFPEIPSAGFTDTLASKTDLLVIGYGLQYQITPKKNGVQESWFGEVSRNSATVQIVNSNFAGSDKYLKLTANNGQDRGGVSFGDSGGPVIYRVNDQNIVLAVHAFVSSANCGGVSYHTRIDTQDVLTWISDIPGAIIE